MKLLLYDMGSYTQKDIADTLENMGIEYKNVLYTLANIHEDAYFKKRVEELLAIDNYDAVLSVNYFPILADICKESTIPYLSWSYDSPLNINHIEQTLGYETNYVFFFDCVECEKYWKRGYKNVYHLPLAVNTKRLDAIKVSNEDKLRYQADVSMVGQLYKDDFEVLLMPLAEYDKGYLNAAIEVQLMLYGAYILDEVLNEDLLKRMNDAYASIDGSKLRLTKSELAIMAAKHLTHVERTVLLDILSDEYDVHLYGPDKEESLAKVRWHGSAGYFDEMPKVFKESKINLNVSLKCIQSGIPLRVLDILGCGGFLLTNYQPEIAEYFIDGEEVVMYTSMEDAVAKCHYYLEHEEERKQIAANGYQKVKEMFGYQQRIEVMLQAAGLVM